MFLELHFQLSQARKNRRASLTFAPCICFFQALRLIGSPGALQTGNGEFIGHRRALDCVFGQIFLGLREGLITDGQISENFFGGCCGAGVHTP